MVSTEYPPITGGVGRYTEKLTKSLRKLGMDVYVACNDAGKGDFSGLSPQNDQNSQVLLKIVDNIKPDSCPYPVRARDVWRVKKP